jgi:hypothetical protein
MLIKCRRLLLLLLLLLLSFFFFCVIEAFSLVDCYAG